MNLGVRSRNGSQHSDRASPISHLERLPRIDAFEPLARMLTEFPNPDPLHVLHGSTSLPLNDYGYEVMRVFEV